MPSILELEFEQFVATKGQAKALSKVRTDDTVADLVFVDLTTKDTIIRPYEDTGSIRFEDSVGNPLAVDFAVPWANVTGTPTTLAGYGITDAAALVHTHAWADVSKAGSSLADLATRSAADLTSGTLADARVAQSNVTQHQAALALAASQITSGTLGVARGGTGLGTLGTAGQVLRVDAGGTALEFADPGLVDGFASIANSSGVAQFAASGSDALQIAAGADIGVTFDAVNKRVTIAFTGSSSGILRGYADITGDTGSIAASGADTVAIVGAGGISTAAASGTPDTLTITLGNHSAALLTSGNLDYARLPTGSGSWDVGVGNTLTLTRALVTGAAVTLGTYLEIPTQSQPSSPTGGAARMWWDDTAGALKVVDDGGTVTSLGTAGTRVAVYRSAAYSVPNAGQWNPIPWDAESTGGDPAGLHDNSTNPSRINIPAWATWAEVAGQITGTTATGDRNVLVRQGGSTIKAMTRDTASSSNNTSTPVNKRFPVTGGSYLELEVYPPAASYALTVGEEASYFTVTFY